MISYGARFSYVVYIKKKVVGLTKPIFPNPAFETKLGSWELLTRTIEAKSSDGLLSTKAD